MVGLLRRDIKFVRVTREVGDEGDGRAVLDDDAAAIGVFAGNDIFEQHAAVFLPVPRGSIDFDADRLEDEVGRVDLIVRVRIRNADDFAFVLEDKDVVYITAGAELAILFGPAGEDGLDLVGREFGERDVVQRRVADDAGDAFGRRVAEDAGRLF
ncbi:MAG: hypothetical protein U0805_06350 [Pirellulales bacterium]